MRELIGTIIIIVPLLSHCEAIDTALCVHTKSDSYCTRDSVAAQKGTP